MKNYINNYLEKRDPLNLDLENYSKELIEDCKKNNIEVTGDSKKLKNMVSTDLRDNVPPQIYFIVSGIIDIINTIEND